MLNPHHVLILARRYVRRTLDRRGLVVLAAGLLLVLALGWNGKSLTLFGSDVLLKGYRRGFTSTGAKLLLLHEAFGHATVVGVLVGYLLPRLLFPLTESFTVNQVLWLRLTSATQGELAAARALAVLSAAAWVGGLGMAWTTSAAAFHGLPLTVLSTGPLATTAYVLLSGGLVLAAGEMGALAGAARRSLAVGALLAPVLLFLASLPLGAAAGRWFPYAAPYVAARDGIGGLSHVMSAALLGVFLLSVHVLMATVRARPSPLTHPA